MGLSSAFSLQSYSGRNGSFPAADEDIVVGVLLNSSNERQLLDIALGICQATECPWQSLQLKGIFLKKTHGNFTGESCSAVLLAGRQDLVPAAAVKGEAWVRILGLLSKLCDSEIISLTGLVPSHFRS